jgi:hypothetical protein
MGIHSVTWEPVRNPFLVQEAIFSILSHKENATQNYTKIPSHSSHIDQHQENKQQILARMQEEKKLLYTVGGNVN